MKKILILALVLAAGVMAFTGCKKDKDKVDSPLVGTWRHQTDPSPDSGWYCVYIAKFGGDNSFAYYDFAYAGPSATQAHDGFVWRGTYEINEDIATVHFQKYGEVVSDGKEVYDDTFEPYDEKMKFRIEGNFLHLTREYGTPHAWTDVIYTKQK